MSGGYRGGCFQIGFDRRRILCSSINMQEDNFVVSVVVLGAFYLERPAHQLCSIESPSNGFVGFEQHDPKLIPPNAKQFFS